MHMCMCIRMYVCICMYAYRYVCMCVYARVHAVRAYMHVDVCMCV